MNALVLLSGGIDSSGCVAFYRQAGHEVTGVFVDYGQPVREREERSARAIAHHYDIPLHVIRSSGPRKEFEGEIGGRNAFLAFAALLYLPNRTGLIALGIHAGTVYYDCSGHFIEHLNALLSGYSDGKLAVAAPFLTWSKQAIYAFCAENRVPVELTWSCEVGPLAPCGRCVSCEDRGHLNVCTAK
jgi:7-cyano-7-deazaguanine synthase